MAWRNPSSFAWFNSRTRVGTGARARMLGVALVAVGTCAGANACGGGMPGGPTDPRLLTISGYVYAEGTAVAGEPALTHVLITVQHAEGAPHTTTTDGAGFYTLPVRVGNVSITASKAGYLANSSPLGISISTVLNFSLTPA